MTSRQNASYHRAYMRRLMRKGLSPEAYAEWLDNNPDYRIRRPGPKTISPKPKNEIDSVEISKMRQTLAIRCEQLIAELEPTFLVKFDLKREQARAQMQADNARKKEKKAKQRRLTETDD